MKDLLDKYIKPNTKVIDIGCGDKQYSRYVETKECNVTTVDAWIDTNPDFLVDLELSPLPFKDNSFDSALMIDVIEHLTKEGGERLLKEVQRVVKTNIILTTPLWWSDNKHNVENPKLWCYGNDYDLHKSLWTPEDFDGREDGGDWVRDHGGYFEKYEYFYVGCWYKTLNI